MRTKTVTALALIGGLALLAGSLSPSRDDAAQTPPGERLASQRAPDARSALANVRGRTTAPPASTSVLEELNAAAHDGIFDAELAAFGESPDRLKEAHAALAALDEESLASAKARVTIYALGRIGHPSSAGPLAELVGRELPPKTSGTHEYSPYAEAAITRGMALEALEAVAADEAAGAHLDSAIDGVLRRKDSNHLVALAAQILKRRFTNPEEDQEQLELRLGDELVHLARLELRTDPPSTEATKEKSP